MKRIALVMLLAAGTLRAADITPDRLLQAQSHPNKWLMYSKNYSGWRYSDLTQINTTNVSRLVSAWQFQSPVPGKFESSPLVFDGMMYFTAPTNHAYALDLASGHQIWHYAKALPPGVSICCGQVNRGFAALGSRL